MIIIFNYYIQSFGMKTALCIIEDALEIERQFNFLEMMLNGHQVAVFPSCDFVNKSLFLSEPITTTLIIHKGNA